jgi:amylosucrase
MGMHNENWIAREAERALQRLLPRVRQAFSADPRKRESWPLFGDRLEREWPGLFRLLVPLYGQHYDFFYHLEQLLRMLARSWLTRPEHLRALDGRREKEPAWFKRPEVIGGVLYVDLFSDNLALLHEHIPYFKELHLSYLHLMPIFAVPHGENDGGYAVSSYRAVNPDLGTMEQLAELARILGNAGISLALDFVFNHTSDEHEWARRAQAGDLDFQAYYHTFPDRSLPDRYESSLREIFPTMRRGSFTWRSDMQRWVWTTFNSYQWDLNYANPAVFRAMAQEMLFLANTGVEVLRLDAVAFIWKALGTDCENRPEAHLIIQAFNRLARIAAPALLFKSEAIVHPEAVLSYVDPGECQLSYNPQFMALLWEAVATRRVSLLRKAMSRRARLQEGCAWVNYLRCHDDIGWTFDDDDAWAVGLNPHDHRRFLNAFYSGRFEGSFARGVPFQFNPETGDMRISGTLASLAGLEQALEREDALLIEMAVRRIMMLRSLVMSAAGIPLIYLGDEWGMLNDYTYLSEPAKANDSRWVHRSRRKWERRDLADGETIEWRLFEGLRQLIQARKRLPALGNGDLDVCDTGTPHVFGFLREGGGQRLLILANFTETPQAVPLASFQRLGFLASLHDHIGGQTLAPDEASLLGPYQYRWLEALAPGGN